MKLVRRSNNVVPTFSRFFDDFFADEFFNKPIRQNEAVPPVNVKESETGYDLEVAIPGFNKEDINIEVKDDLLTIASRQESKQEVTEDNKFTRKEFSFKSFKRMFSLPKTVDKEAIKADYKDGILNVNLPKAEKEEGTKRIEIG